MVETIDMESKPLWVQIEEQIGRLKESDLAEGAKEKTVHAIAAKLDEQGLNVSNTGRKLLSVRWALDARARTGRPLITDLHNALSELSLENLGNVDRVAYSLVDKLGAVWPELTAPDRVADIRAMVETVKLDLMIEKAKSLGEEDGIRYLRDKDLPTATILERLGTTQETVKKVDAAIAAEKAEAQRVRNLLGDVAEQPELDRIKHLLSHGVKDALIVTVGGFSESAIAEANKAMEEELKEKQRLAEEEAARKKAAAEGPALEDIAPDDMLGYIEELRDILDFSDVEKEIRVMAEQSKIPKSLVDVAVADRDKLDELEEKAQAG